MTLRDIFGTVNRIRSSTEFTEEQLPAVYKIPENPTIETLLNDRLDFICYRVYGTLDSIALRTLLWANDFSYQEWMRVLPEGIVVNTPPLEALRYTKRQEILP